MTKEEVLDAAKAAVSGRQLNYGAPEQNFDRIAARWRAHVFNRYGMDVPIDGASVAMMLIDLKIARLENCPTHADSIVDVVGYALCLADIVGRGD